MYANQNRQAVTIATALVDAALAEGYSISVHDSEVWALKRSRDRAAILDAMGNTDSDSLRFRDAAGANVGFVWLIYENGRDVVSDHSAEGPIAALAERFYSAD